MQNCTFKFYWELAKYYDNQDARKLLEGIQIGGGGDGAGETRLDKPNSAPVGSGFNEECINDHN